MKLLTLLLLFTTSVYADTPPPRSTDQLREGVTNLYFTTARFNSAIAGAISATAPLQYSLGVFSMPAATSGTNGYLTLSDWNIFNGKEPALSAGLSSQYYRGDKTWATLSTSVVPEGSNLYYTSGRFDTAFATKSTTNLAEGSNLYFTNARVDTEFDTRLATKSTSNLTEGSNLYYTSGRFDTALASKTTTHLTEGSNLYYTAARFNTAFAAKSTSNLAEGTNLYFTDARAQNAVFSRLNYITNPDAEVNTSGWNLYNDTGRTASAFVVDQDITYTSVLSGGSGNGATISYVLGSSPYAEPPVVTCPTGTSVQVAWYNGPTLSSNPTATVLKAAFDATPCAVAIASAAITGNASTRQYLTGTVTLAGGGDTSPVNGTGGSPTGLTFTRSTSGPLVGSASFLQSKTSTSQLGSGVSTDFEINSADRGNTLQISFYYSAGVGFTYGAASDVKIFLYDITNNAMLPLTRSTLTGPTVDVVYRYAGQFHAAPDSTSYRLILHTATSNATAWDLKLDSVTVNSTLDVEAATQVPKVVLPAQAITGSVTDHMAVMRLDGDTSWRPATAAGGADPSNLFGFATNLVGLTADITTSGALDGFSFGPFVGYNQYVDVTAGGISPLPASFTDTYVTMGKGLTSDTILVQPRTFNRLVTSKGGLLTNGGLNNGTGDVVVAGGTTGQFLRYNTALTNGFSAFTPVATAPIVYTAATSTWSCTTATDSVAGCMSAADHTVLSGHTTTLALKANLASPTFTGTPTLPTGTIGVTQTAANSTTALATTAFVTTADNLKANLASPTFTGDVNSSTGNVLVSTIGKGLQVKTGTNAKIGTATLVSGAATVANTSVTANSRIFLTSNTDGGTPGWLRVSAKTNGTSFVITSSSATDTSTVAWLIVESIP